ncbi:MAG: hypothetical protein K8T25_07275 [Planctomycetia bacterium]|nr:hypothetical protein [Planctomycetia bacterium]
MTEPRLQFSLRGILYATFWVAVFAGAGMITRGSDAEASPLFVLGLRLVLLISPVVAVTALFERATLGLLLSVATIGVFLVVLICGAMAMQILGVK